MPPELESIDPYSPDAERIWTSFAPPSFFLSWGWIENWLACLPHGQAPRLGVFRDRERVVAACFLGRRLTLRRRVIPLRSYHLNTTGVGRLDNIWIEYNGVVGTLTLGDLLGALPDNWDELELPGLDDRALGGVQENPTGPWRVRIERRVPAFMVDLAAVRAEGYLAKLSGQTRSQIRRAQKAAGKLAVEVATTEAHAISIYGELCALHNAHWRTRGEPGVFADPWFDRFHRRLITRRFGAGEIQLVRVRASDGATLGCLYNFVWDGRVLQYQTGLTSSDDARAKPGFVCHTAAVEHSAAAGLALYDFLGGDVRYKRSLSTDCGWLLWCRVQRPRLRFLLEEQLTTLVRTLRERRQARQA